MESGFTCPRVDRRGLLPSSLESQRSPIASADGGVDSYAPGSLATRHVCVWYASRSPAGASWTSICTSMSMRHKPLRFFGWKSGWPAPSSVVFLGDLDESPPEGSCRGSDRPQGANG